MKRNSILFLLIMFTVSNLSAQSGIYLNWQDYNKGKLSFTNNCDNRVTKIKLNDFFSKSYIEVMQNGKSIRLSKDSIFGYRDCKQGDFRFYKNHKHEYKILENKNIVIYLALLPVQSSSEKTTELVPTYFFSAALGGAILPLTIPNLKKSFPGNIKFHDALDASFSDGTSLSTYDELHKTFKINFLLNQSSK